MNFKANRQKNNKKAKTNQLNKNKTTTNNTKSNSSPQKSKRRSRKDKTSELKIKLKPNERRREDCCIPIEIDGKRVICDKTNLTVKGFTSHVKAKHKQYSHKDPRNYKTVAILDENGRVATTNSYFSKFKSISKRAPQKAVVEPLLKANAATDNSDQTFNLGATLSQSEIEAFDAKDPENYVSSDDDILHDKLTLKQNNNPSIHPITNTPTQYAIDTSQDPIETVAKIFEFKLKTEIDSLKQQPQIVKDMAQSFITICKNIIICI